MNQRKITAFRLVCLLISTFVLTYGSYFLGSCVSLLLPVFACAYVPTGSASGVCKTIVTLSYSLMESTGTALFSLIGFLLLCILGVMIFGRLWCGYICPFGFYQELLTMLRKKLRIPAIHVSEKVKPFFRLLKWILLLCFVFGIGFCNLCPVKYIMPSLAGYGSDLSILGIIIAGIVTGICFLKERAFCEYCPLGTLMGFANKISIGKIKKNGAACTHCRACLECCPMDIHVIYEERLQSNVTHTDCIYCMKCIEACPEPDTLSFTLFGKKILKSKRKIK